MSSTASESGLLRLGAIGLVAGTMVGLLGGVASRLAMRLVALAGGVAPVLTGEGTLLVLLTGLFYAITGAVLFLVLRPRLPGTEAGKAFTFGLIVLVAFGPAFFIADQAGELGVSPSVGIAAFSALFVVGGTLIGLGNQAVEQRFSPRGNLLSRVLGVVGWAVVVGSAPAVVATYVLAVMRIVGLTVR
jgi:hypothetical protein